MAVLCGCTSKEGAEFTRTIPWALTGDWLVGDLHTHSRFSDGVLSAGDLVERAVLSGCQVMALTDHSDLTGDIATASPEYMAALRQLRSRYPGLVLIGGIEWNIPPYEGREHVNLLVDPSIESEVLPLFRQQFDSLERGQSEDDTDPAEALAWLSARVPAQSRAVLFYNHPSRKVDELDDTGVDLLRWRRVSPRMIGFEGGPGHQRSSIIGSYKKNYETIDRWDPVVANIGGVWDSLLARGEDVWAAMANSDYHNDKLDYAPCTFSRIHFQVPESTEKGVLEALEAGSFWAQHGPVLDDLLFAAHADGLDLPAVPGETISLNAVQTVSFHLAIERNANAAHDPLQTELVSNCRSGTPELVNSRMLSPDETGTSWELQQLQAGADGKSCYARMRVRKQVDNGPDLLAYTNSIRIIIN